MSIIDQILDEAQPAVDLYKQIKDSESRSNQQNYENELARLRVQSDVTRAQAEATAQQRALLSQVSMTDDLKKWLNWAVAGLGLISSAIAVGTFIRKRKKRK